MSKFLDELNDKRVTFRIYGTPPCSEADYEFANGFEECFKLVKKHNQKELTEEQQDIYDRLMEEYGMETSYVDMKRGIVKAIDSADLENETDETLIPVLRKFLNEVAE